VGSGLRLVGLVASLRVQASLLLPVSLMSCIPAYAWGAHQLAPIGSVGIALILLTAAFLAFLKARDSGEHDAALVGPGRRGLCRAFTGRGAAVRAGGATG
jgi:hypothetical protein